MSNNNLAVAMFSVFDEARRNILFCFVNACLFLLQSMFLYVERLTSKSSICQYVFLLSICFSNRFFYRVNPIPF